MKAIRDFLTTILRYARVFSWPQLALFKINDLLTGCLSRPAMRRIRALRVFSYAVPPETLSVSPGEYRFQYHVNGHEVAVALRNGSSDIDVFLQVLRHGEYSDVVGMLGDFGRPVRIIDAGANVGLTTLYFKCFHPDARIVALEPEPGNFERLCRCVRDNDLSDLTLLNEGLWTRDTRMVPDRTFRDGREWSFALKEAASAEQGGVLVTSLASLLQRMGWDYVDLLKVDIEGAEAALVRDASFLATVREKVWLLCVEVHEEMIRRVEVQRALASIGLWSVRGTETLVAFRSAPPGDAWRS